MQPPPTAGVPAAATYGGTGGTLLRTGGWAVLLDVTPGHPLVARCWDRLEATSDVDELLGAVVTEDLRTVPAFALVRETGVRRVVARGALRLVVDGLEVQADRPAGAWLDLPLGEASTVEVTLPTDGSRESSLLLRDGVAVAAGFHLVLLGADPGGRDLPRTDDTQPFFGTLGGVWTPR